METGKSGSFGVEKNHKFSERPFVQDVEENIMFEIH
jgi:hypothetical protein